MDHFERTLSSETLYAGKILSLRLDEVVLENGRSALREVVEHGGGVTIVAPDEADNLLFVRQYRHPYGQVLLELPAGKLEKGEDPAACALRELEEETGYAAREIVPLGELYPSPGYVSEVLYLFLAKGLLPSRQKLDLDEFLTVEKIPLDKAVEMCLSGEIKDAKTLAAVLKYAWLRREKMEL